MPNRIKDLGEKETDKLLDELEKKIAKEYSTALKEVQNKYEKFAEKFADQEAKQKKLLDDGKITVDDFKKWKQAKLQSSKQYQDLINTLSADMAKVDQKVMSIANGYMPEAYALNFNYSTYEIETNTSANTSFNLYSRETVERLIKQDEINLPKRKVDIPLDQQWNKQHLNSAITQGILQGKSIPDIAKNLQQVTDMGRRAAVRNARTMMTGAQNSGRIDAYDRASYLGIKIQKEWMATLDTRTRDSHAKMDGERVDYDDKFSNGLMYPGDPAGDPSEVYNCRCTLVAVYSEYKDVMADRVTYNKWKQDHDTVEEATEYVNPITIEKYKEVKEKYEIDHSDAESNFKSKMERELQLQDGVANKENFFYQTTAEFEEVKRPDREPDYVSRNKNGEISSEYWYTDEGVIRGSDHWGLGVSTCDWALIGKNQEFFGDDYDLDVEVLDKRLYGKASWDSFVQKARIVKTDEGEQFVTTFNNTIGRDIYKFNGKEYSRNEDGLLSVVVPKVSNTSYEMSESEKLEWKAKMLARRHSDFANWQKYLDKVK